MTRGKRVFKKNSASRKKRTKERETVLQFREWQKEIIRVFNSLERRIRKVSN